MCPVYGIYPCCLRICITGVAMSAIEGTLRDTSAWQCFLDMLLTITPDFPRTEDSIVLLVFKAVLAVQMTI